MKNGNGNGNTAMKGKTLMIVGGGLMQIPAIRLAKEMGLTVVVSDFNPEALGMKIADFALTVSTRDIDGTIRAAREFHKNRPINGVITVGTDASRTVSAVANALGLPGIRYEVAERATNKIKMRKRFKDKGVPIPPFRSVWTLDEAKRAVEEFSLPLVVKPADNMGARGVKKIIERNDIVPAFYEAKAASISGEIIVEGYVEGRELSIDALVYEGKIHFMGVADRIIEYAPYFVETGHIMPTDLPKKKVDEVLDVMKKGIEALGITHGAAKGDIRLTDKGPVIIELAARLSGGFMSAYTFPYATGVSSIKGAVEIALGLPPSETEYTYKQVCMEGAIIAQQGRVVSVSGVDLASKLTGVQEVFIHHEPGTYVNAPTDNLGKSGNLIITGKTRSAAKKIYEKAKSLIRFEVGEPPTLTANQIKAEARKKMYLVCKVCDICDGYACAGKVPGMGGVGTASSFKANLEALAAYRLNIKVIHEVKNPSVSSSLFGVPLDLPVITAPMTGTTTNMGGQITEEAFVESIVQGSILAGTIAMVGDGATPDKYRIGLDALKKSSRGGIPIFKPREFNAEIIMRIKEAEQSGAIAVGVDVDSAALITMRLKNQLTGPKSLKDLQEIRRSTKLPFVVKGIMNPDDALLAVEAGADCLVVSNHGGRVMDFLPGAAEILPHIVEICRGKVKIVIDGGIRTGVDVLKCLALGADCVSIGRPVSIFAIGGGAYGVKYYYDSLKEELHKAMILTGTPSVSAVTAKVLYHHRDKG